MEEKREEKEKRGELKRRGIWIPSHAAAVAFKTRATLHHFVHPNRIFVCPSPCLDSPKPHSCMANPHTHVHAYLSRCLLSLANLHRS